jgi:glycerophosphoryl diester phosphodiesterase
MNKKNNSNILVFAHRGASKDFPENTMPAFRRAVDLGVDVIETDVHLTKDGRYVIIHDDSIERITDGRGKVCEYTLNELMQFDAGYNFSNDGGNSYPFRGKGIRLVSLEEMLGEFPDQRFNIDLKDKKPEQAEAFIGVLRRYNALDRVIAASWHCANLKALRKTCREIFTSFSSMEVLWVYFLYKSGLLFFKKSLSGCALQIPEKWGQFNLISRGFLKEVHSKGVDVHVWTINSENDMRRIMESEVDGIMSDDPELLLKILGRLDRAGT